MKWPKALILFIIIATGFSKILFGQNNMVEHQSKNPLQAGIASKNITPDAKVKNWVTGDPYKAIHDSIYTRVLILKTIRQKVALVQWDLVDAGESATDRVRMAIAEALDIPKQNILIHASHNHSAPWAPVYNNEHRGKERDTWWTVRYMPPQHEEPHFKKWMQRLVSRTVAAARRAERTLKPATVWIGRADISEFLRNRRPRPANAGIKEDQIPDNYNYRHKNWDPNILSGAKKFGPMDRAMTLISLRHISGKNIATLFHLSCHAVSMYPYMDAISGDWPGETIRRMNEELGGQSMFLQGTAGDINPWRRGPAAVDTMAKGLTSYARKAYNYSAQLQPGTLDVARIQLELPLTDYGQKRTGLNSLPAEILTVVYGPLAIVTLPGEPMTELGMAIRKRSPFPQTLVLGYSNGNGIHYVGMPAEKAYGGYEAGEKTSLGTERAGLMMVEAAEELLHEVYGRHGKQEKDNKD